MAVRGGDAAGIMLKDVCCMAFCTYMRWQEVSPSLICLHLDSVALAQRVAYGLIPAGSHLHAS